MTRRCVLVFAGSDPSGGAGLQADLQAIAAQGAHALTVVTAVTVQDNDRVFSVNAVAAELVTRQAQALIDKIDVAAVKIGIPGSLPNAEAIAAIVAHLHHRNPGLPVVLDTVLASGKGDALSSGDPIDGVRSLLPHATLVMPNLPEAARLCPGQSEIDVQAQALLRACPNVLIKGGHGGGDEVVNTWFARDVRHSWRWPRLAGQFHGTGCTLASAVAGLLAQGLPMRAALEAAQSYVHQTLVAAYAIAPGQRIPQRSPTSREIQ
ncbi:MAG TPA: hydroxymethylpyrimidine/phosphomethylpyrimidine kinase [Noviherbaspirillum sp.]|nr:hydroxymethylpyrimidine/phosphomethylpyrimidine kinase [Noviherbaspirillum sp.]